MLRTLILLFITFFGTRLKMPSKRFNRSLACRELKLLPLEDRLKVGLQALEKLTRHDSRMTVVR